MIKLARGMPAISTFIKTESSQLVEILALCGLDFVILDAEHAPFDRAGIDRMLLAARGSGLPMLVRIPEHNDATILTVLDSGASGIVVPQVDSADQARNVVSAARFIGGKRGISMSARFAGFGTRSRAEAIAEADRSVVICQIESAAGVEAAAAIAEIPGVGALFIGRADLALSLGEKSVDAASVRDATIRIIAAAHARDIPAILACNSVADAEILRSFGVDMLVIGSDQSLLRDAASRLSDAKIYLSDGRS